MAFNYAGGNPATPQGGANPFRVEPQGDLTGPLSGLGETLAQVGREKKAEARFNEVQGAMQKAWESRDPEEMARVSAMYPEARESMEIMFGFTNDQSEKAARETYQNVLTDPDNALEYLAQGIQQVTEATGRPPKNMLMDLGRLRSAEKKAIEDPENATKYKEEALNGIELGYAGVASPQQWKAYQKQRGIGGEGDTSAIRNRESLFKILEDPDAPKWKKDAAKVELGTLARAGTSAAERIAEEGKTDLVAESEATIAGAKAGASEEAKLLQRGKYEPAIKAAVKSAEIAAKARGETLTQVNKEKASLPGLEVMASQLTELAPMATYTLAGKFWDQAVKQTGFGATEGATARAKYQAIIDNQVLPLLKETFGAQMTEGEGLRLANTLGDVDATPEEKQAQLSAFLAQKRRNIQAGERELAESAEGDAPLDLPAPGQQPREVTTQAQFDALPSGTIYLENGVQYRKP